MAAQPPLSALPRADIAAALQQLDRATREFARRLSTTNGGPTQPGEEGGEALLRDDAVAAHMRDAEREARAYLEHAKRRADSLVASMVRAVEAEAAQIRREAEDGARNRRQEAEAEAHRYIDDAVAVADSMVAEREQRIAALSDSICDRAETLTAGMEDAEKVRHQFEAFVRSLSATADRIAEGSNATAQPRPSRLHQRKRPPRDDAVAA